jgi:uncharacterized protein YdhG (YjbR/CyaY superfamily)
MRKKKTPTDIDAYLATLSLDKQAALQKLRRTLSAVAPEAEECISYPHAASSIRINVRIRDVRQNVLGLASTEG